MREYLISENRYYLLRVLNRMMGIHPWRTLQHGTSPKLNLYYRRTKEQPAAAMPVLVISFSLCVLKKWWCAKKFRDHVTLYVNEVQGI